MSRIFLSKSPTSREVHKIHLLLKEALVRLFPRAHPFQEADLRLGGPSTFFLREEGSILWIEIGVELLSREGLTCYLAKAKQIQTFFPEGKIYGVFVAPDFEAELTGLLEWLSIPIRLFRYREVVELENQPAEPSLWIEELNLPSSRKIAFSHNPSSFPSFQETALGGGLESHWNRLTREELRDFIQFEIDFACNYK